MGSRDTDWPQLDDTALVQAVQRGEARAFEPLVDRHLAAIHAFVALKLPVAHLVDEITHETFVAAFRLLPEFNAGTNLRAWLRALAANLVRTELARFHREQTNKLGYAERREIELALAEADEFASREADALRECLEAVPEPMRALLEMKYRDGCTAEEIGGRLVRSLAWVRTTLFRLRQQLRECIESKLGGSSHAGA
jgi:RNA polymerase sigma-70 factor (ECF subfamily)